MSTFETPTGSRRSPTDDCPKAPRTASKSGKHINNTGKQRLRTIVREVKFLVINMQYYHSFEAD